MRWKKGDATVVHPDPKTDLTQASLPENLRKLSPELLKFLDREKLIVQFPELSQIKLGYTHENKNQMTADHKFWLAMAFILSVLVLGIVAMLH